MNSPTSAAALFFNPLLHFREMQWKEAVDWACCGLITHCKADRYFHQLHLGLSESATFPLPHTACAKEIYGGLAGRIALNCALSLQRDGGLSSSLNLGLSGRPIKPQNDDAVSHFLQTGLYRYHRASANLAKPVAFVPGFESRAPLTCQLQCNRIYLHHISVRLTA